MKSHIRHGVKLYCGVGETNWNAHEVQPGAYACVSPVYGKTERTKRQTRVRLPSDTAIIQDSGAFSDSTQHRLSFAEALDRQIEHGIKYGYDAQITHRASYDMLIDEMWTNGQRTKVRWNYEDAKQAVKTTIKAAEYTVLHNDKKSILSAQGVTPTQYFECIHEIIPMLGVDDILGLGGWCIVGKVPSLMQSFIETINLVIPYASQREVKRVHIWGVIYAPAIGRLSYLCDKNNIQLSTDSVGVQLRPKMGLWGYDDWIDYNYKTPDVSVLGLYRARHVQQVRRWLARSHQWKHYRKLNTVYIPDRKMQPALF